MMLYEEAFFYDRGSSVRMSSNCDVLHFHVRRMQSIERPQAGLFETRSSQLSPQSF
jgi:hypothetical protein